MFMKIELNIKCFYFLPFFLENSEVFKGKLVCADALAPWVNRSSAHDIDCRR